MTEDLGQASPLLESRTNLLRMRRELWLNEAEIAIVDRGIVTLDQLFAELSTQ